MKIKVLLSFVAMIGLAHVSIAETVEEEIAERIRKVGNVCIEGQDCAAGGEAEAGESTAEAGGGTDVQAIYNRTCANCHDAGVAEAPRLGNAEEWAPRLEKGVETLYESAINGLPPAMPAKGTCFDCSDEELKALVDYMVEASE